VLNAARPNYTFQEDFDVTCWHVGAIDNGAASSPPVTARTAATV
jgi:hypothetical protein